MRANNARLMSTPLLKQMKDKYIITYDAETNTILVAISTSKRVTKHDANNVFHVNSKQNPKRKVCFNRQMIDIWLEFLKDDKTKDISIFDVHNAAVKLKVMYQPINAKTVLKTVRTVDNKIKEL